MHIEMSGGDGIWYLIKYFKNTIEGLKGITRIDFCVMDTDGKSLASTFSEQDNYEEEAVSFVESPADSQVVQGYQFFKVFDEHQLEYILLANGAAMMYIW